jgi:hypothetical protein
MWVLTISAEVCRKRERPNAFSSKGCYNKLDQNAITELLHQAKAPEWPGARIGTGIGIFDKTVEKCICCSSLWRI